MSAVLSIDEIQPVADLLERLQNVQRALKDLHDAHEGNAEFGVAITLKTSGRDAAVAHTHQLSYWIVQQGLAAMERELLKQLDEHEITVESALPMKEHAAC